MMSVYPRLQEPSYKPAKPASLAQTHILDTPLSPNVDDRVLPEFRQPHTFDQPILSTYHLERRTFL